MEAALPRRFARGGEILAPANLAHPVQFVDVRDLATWTLHMVEQKATGVYNATGPAQPLTLGKLLTTCQQVSGTQSNFTWVSEEFLLAQEVGAFVEMPLWTSAAEAGIEQVDCRKAIQAGLHFRPLAETIADTLAWSQTRPTDHTWRAGLTAEREATLLATWQQGKA